MDRILDLDKAPPYVEVYKHAPLMYMAICDFEEMSCQLQPDDWLRWVHAVHSEVDSIAVQCGIYKVKTGAQGGSCAFSISPDMPSKEQAAIMLSSARLLLQAMSQIKSPTGEPLALQITIHAGQYAGGIVGTGSWTYDLYGEQVTALLAMDGFNSRNCIQVSGDALALLPHPEQFQYAYSMSLGAPEGPAAAAAPPPPAAAAAAAAAGGGAAATAAAAAPAGASSNSVSMYVLGEALPPEEQQPQQAQAVQQQQQQRRRQQLQPQQQVGTSSSSADAAGASRPSPTAAMALRPKVAATRRPPAEQQVKHWQASKAGPAAEAGMGGSAAAAGPSQGPAAAAAVPARPVPAATAEVAAAAGTSHGSGGGSSSSRAVSPGSTCSTTSVYFAEQRRDLSFRDAGVEARFVAKDNASLSHLDQMFILLSLLVSLSCYWGTAGQGRWDVITWLCSATFWLTPLMALGFNQLAPGQYQRWREALWSCHRVLRVGVLCCVDAAAAATISAAALPWLRFGMVAMMIDSLGFKVRFWLHCLVTATNMLLMLAATWAKLAAQQHQQEAVGPVVNAAAKALLLRAVLPSLLVFYWESMQRQWFRWGGKRLVGKVYSSKAKLKVV